MPPFSFFGITDDLGRDLFTCIWPWVLRHQYVGSTGVALYIFIVVLPHTAAGSMFYLNEP